MIVSFVVPYRLFKFSFVNYDDLFDDNVYYFNKRECDGYFSVKNLSKYNSKSFNEIQRAANLSSEYLLKIEYDKSYDYYFRFDIICTCDKTSKIDYDEIPSNEMRRIRKELLLSSLVEEIHKYLLLLTIKTNNSISIMKGFCIIGKKLIAHTKQILSGLYLEEYKEKIVYNIDLKKAWEFIHREIAYTIFRTF